MIQKKIALKKIKYQTKEFDDKLLESIKIRNIAIAIKVRMIDEDMYECIDGHKRLSVLNELYHDEDYLVNCVIANDFSKAGSGYWGATKNKH